MGYLGISIKQLVYFVTVLQSVPVSDVEVNSRSLTTQHHPLIPLERHGPPPESGSGPGAFPGYCVDGS